MIGDNMDLWNLVEILIYREQLWKINVLANSAGAILKARFISHVCGTCRILLPTPFIVPHHRCATMVTWCQQVYMRKLGAASRVCVAHMSSRVNNDDQTLIRDNKQPDDTDDKSAPLSAVTHYSKTKLDKFTRRYKMPHDNDHNHGRSYRKNKFAKTNYYQDNFRDNSKTFDRKSMGKLSYQEQGRPESAEVDPDESSDAQYMWKQLPEEDRFGAYGEEDKSYLYETSQTTERSRRSFDPRQGSPQWSNRRIDATRGPAETSDLRRDDRHGRSRGSDLPTYPRHEPGSSSGGPSKWADVFGTQVLPAYKRSAETQFGDESDDEEHHVPLSSTNRRHNPNWYGRRIQKLGKSGQILEAIEMLESQMLKQDRVKPSAFEFRALISSLGRVGYTKKAFKLYNKMLKMGIRPDHHTYTCLFNACANSPFPRDGLQQAERLYDSMKEKDYTPQYITYQAMIKAFGMCGDIETAFHLADQCAREYRVTDNVLSSLLVACLSDSEAGLRHAIMVWRKMTALRIKPTTRDYNLLLRAVNTCGVGDQNLFSRMILGTSSNKLASLQTSQQYLNTVPHNKLSGQKTMTNLIGGDVVKSRKEARVFMQAGKLAGDDVCITGNTAVESGVAVDEDYNTRTSVKPLDGNISTVESVKTLEKDSRVESVETVMTDGNTKRDSGESVGISTTGNVEPWWTDTNTQGNRQGAIMNVLMSSAPTDNVVSIANMKTASDKLWLLGGLDRLLVQMAGEGARPDSVTFMMLILAVPANQEQAVLDKMAEHNVIPDTDFFNHLIHKRAANHMPKEAWDANAMMGRYKQLPNMKTFGCLAMTCKKPVHGFKLLALMKDMKLEPNLIVMGTLVWQSFLNFRYKANLIRYMDGLDMEVTERFIGIIESSISHAKRLLVKQEKGAALTEQEAAELRKLDAEHYEDFLNFYNDWIKTKTLQKKVHLWKEFKPDTKVEQVN